MIHALLAGTKTQTRRIIKPQPTVHPNGAWSWDGRNGGFVGAAGTHVDEGFPEAARDWCRTQPGDKLWVREAHSRVPASAYRCSDGVVQAVNPTDKYDAAVYRADWVRSAPPWRPSIHMPRWASRLTLIVTDVRVQRLQDISEEDARAEGCDQALADAIMKPEELAVFAATHILAPHARARIIFETLWEQINSAGSWAANPWVAAYSFEVHHQNINALPLPAARDAAMKEGGN